MKCARISLVTRTHAGRVPFAMRPGAALRALALAALAVAASAGCRPTYTCDPGSSACHAKYSCEFSAPCLPGATCTQSFDIGDGVDKTSGLPFNYSTASGSVTGGSLGGRSYCGPAGCDDNALALTFQSADLSVKWVSASCESRETPEQCRLATKTPIPASPPLTKVTAQQTCLNKVTPCTYYKAEATVDFRAAVAWLEPPSPPPASVAAAVAAARAAAAAAVAAAGARRVRAGRARAQSLRRVSAGALGVPRGVRVRGVPVRPRARERKRWELLEPAELAAPYDAGAVRRGPRRRRGGRAAMRGAPVVLVRARVLEAQRAGRHGRLLGVPPRAGGRRVTRTRCCNARERNNRTRATPERERRRFSRAVTKPTPASSTCLDDARTKKSRNFA